MTAGRRVRRWARYQGGHLWRVGSKRCERNVHRGFVSLARVRELPCRVAWEASFVSESTSVPGLMTRLYPAENSGVLVPDRMKRTDNR